MNFKCYLMLILAIASTCYGVKVNMYGSVSIGKEVLDTLLRYLGTNGIDTRRTKQFSKETDTLYLLIKYTYLCRDTPFCKGELEVFINEYITLLTKAVGTALNFSNDVTSHFSYADKKHIFEKPLQRLLNDIKKILRATNMVVTEKNEHYLWKEVIKRICAMFQVAAEEYSTIMLSTDSGVTRVQNNKMIHKIVIATTTVESAYEIKLCKDHAICPRSYECTKSLNILLGALENLELEKIKVFIKHFSSSLSDTTFYSYVDENIANHLQITFDEMAYSGNVSINKVFNHFHSIVETVIQSLKTKIYLIGSKDAELAHIILSDMDHFYETRKLDPFHTFLRNFFNWIRLGKDVKQPIREVITDISNHINSAPEPLQLKLIREVKVYLELLEEPDFDNKV